MHSSTQISSVLNEISPIQSSIKNVNRFQRHQLKKSTTHNNIALQVTNYGPSHLEGMTTLETPMS